MREAANPARDPAIQELVRRVRRAYAARGARPASKTVLTKDPLAAVAVRKWRALLGRIW